VLLNLLEVASQGVATWCLMNDRRRLTGRLANVFVLIFRARIPIVFTLLLLLALFAAVNVVLQLYSNLSLCRLLLDERVLQQDLRVWPLVVIFHCTMAKKRNDLINFKLVPKM
jgi:hypothetical protein